MSGASSRQSPRLAGARRQGAGRAALLLVVVVWLALVVGVVAQANGAALAGSAPSASTFATTTPTKSPPGKPTPTPTLTATATSSATATPTVAGTPSDTPTDTPTVFVYSGTAPPQPTKLVLSQPTVGSGGGGFGGGVAGLGDSSMFVAVVLGCVTSVLGIVIGGVALLALIRSGYGPFLRALVLGKRARPQGAPTGKAAKGRNGKDAPARAGARGQPGQRVGDGTLNYQETGDLGGDLWRNVDARQSGRQPRVSGPARNPRDLRDPREAGDARRRRESAYADDQRYAADPRDSGRGRAVRQPPRSDPRSRAGAARPPSRPANRGRDDW